MNNLSKLVAGLVVLGFLGLPSMAQAYTLGVGFGGGGTFPLSHYIKAAPTPSGSTTYSLKDVKNGPGWDLHAELLVIGMEIRYTWRVFTWKSITAQDGTAVSTKGLPWLQFHTLTLGYRWYLVNSKFKLYLPIGGGAVFVTYNDPKKLKGQFGGTLYAGVELEYAVAKIFTIGLGARYNFYLTNKPTDIIKGKIEDNLKDAINQQDPSKVNTQMGVKDVVATFHSITANLTFTLAF